MSSRHLPTVCDRDRIAAARYAGERLAMRLNVIAKRKRLVWISYCDSNGQIVSVNQ